MNAVFIETSNFSRCYKDFLTDDSYSEIQQQLLSQPELGDVIPGCGGLRKLRTQAPKRGKGKRSGCRLIYLYVPGPKCFFLLDIYGKDEKDDLSSDEKKLLAQLAEELKTQASSNLKLSRKGKK